MKLSRASLTALLLSSLASMPVAAATKSLPGGQSQTREDTTTFIVTYEPGSVQAQNIGSAMPFERIRVRTEDAEGYAAALRQQPGIARVERDYITRHPDPVQMPAGTSLSQGFRAQALTGTPNDPGFSQQVAWQTPTSQQQGTHDILAAHALSEQNERLRIGIVDSGFFTIQDLQYAGGYNFTSSVNSDYLAPSSCTNPHGTAVASILGATTNNAIGIAGILDAELYPVRALNCDIGSLFDLALAIRWLAGDTVESAPVIEQPVHIINASLGSDTDTCPSYLQEAIDYAHQRDITIVAAAGNESRDASGSSPANCDHVITAGAVEPSGQLWGGTGDGSNYGDTVDVLALGFLVTSLNEREEITQWIGTSFASPIVAGIAGLLLQNNPALSPGEIAVILRQSVRPEVAPTGEKQGQGGILDAHKMMSLWGFDMEEATPDFYQIMDAPERCHREAYTETTVGSDIDRLYEVHVTLNGGIDPDMRYTVFRTQTSGDDRTLLKASEEHRFIMKDVNTAAYQYAFNICDADGNACLFGEDLPMQPRISIASANCSGH